MAAKPPTTKHERELTKRLTRLCQVVKTCTLALDRAMQGPSTEERGKRIAAITNALDCENDSAWHFTLGKNLPVKPLKG